MGLPRSTPVALAQGPSCAGPGDCLGCIDGAAQGRAGSVKRVRRLAQGPLDVELHLGTSMKRTASLLALACMVACSRPPRIPVIVEPLTGIAEGTAQVQDPTPSLPPIVTPPQPAGSPGPASALTAEGFESLGEQRHIRVFRRQVRQGVELAAEGTLGGSPARVLAVLIDYPSHRRWQKHLKEQRILARGDSYLDVYERLDLPVLDDRDFVVHVTWGSEGDLRWMRFVAAISGGPPPVPDVVRVIAHSGSWRLEPVDGGQRTRAVYRFHIDLAGSFPMWLGSGQATNDLPDLFENIDRELPRYP